MVHTKKCPIFGFFTINVLIFISTVTLMLSYFAMSHGSQNSNLGSKRLILPREVGPILVTHTVQYSQYFQRDYFFTCVVCKISNTLDFTIFSFEKLYMYILGKANNKKKVQAVFIHDMAGPKLGAYIGDLKSSPKKLISCKMTLRRVILSMY